MIRPVLTELALFLLPFVLYFVFLWATRAKILDPQAWAWSTIAWLTIAAFVMVVGSFVVIAQFSGSPPGSTYIPAHMEDGKFVPGTAQ
jgi:Family of unknown function (DUF6111)